MIRLTTGALELFLNAISRTLALLKNDKLLDLLLYSFLFVCIFTSTDWSVVGTVSVKGEIFRFDRFRFMNKVNIYYLYAAIFFVIVFIRKFVIRVDRNILDNNNYLKNIFWMFFIPVNAVIYFTITIKDITVDDFGIAPIVKSFIYLSAVYFVQDIFLRNKNQKQLINILTTFQVIIFTRCVYSICKYMLGFGSQILTKGLGLAASTETVLRLGQENDFADYFILLFIIALTRLLFEGNENKYLRLFHILSVLAASYISIMSLRRFTWGEYLVAISTILSFYFYFHKVIAHKKIIPISFLIAIAFSMILYIGPDKLKDNYYIGRALTMLSLLDKSLESDYGTQSHHLDEIEDGWLNVKKHWALGVTLYGGELMERPKTGYQKGKFDEYSIFVHNNYLYVWLSYGVLGILLLFILYVQSIRLGLNMFMKFKDSTGLILVVFMLCQMTKNIVWHTAISIVNITIVYIVLISVVLRLKQIVVFQERDNKKYNMLNPDII